MYYLVDQIKGVGGSRRVIAKFEYFKDLKTYLEAHRVELYKALPEPEKNAPHFKRFKSFEELRRYMDGKSYMGWLMTVIRADDIRRNKGLVRSNVYHGGWVSVSKTSTHFGSDYKNGVNMRYLMSLEYKEIKIFGRALIYRVVANTKLAVKVEWTSPDGTFTKWIPKEMLL